MEYISANRYLSRKNESKCPLYSGRILSHNWTVNAIAGVLGNMEVESTINPGIWENLQEGNMSGGYGLVQWTPATKYTNWADSRGLEWGHPDSQIARILYEVENNIQWIHPSMTFKEFTISTLPPYDLAVLFRTTMNDQHSQMMTTGGERLNFGMSSSQATYHHNHHLKIMIF